MSKITEIKRLMALLNDNEFIAGLAEAKWCYDILQGQGTVRPAPVEDVRLEERDNSINMARTADALERIADALEAQNAAALEPVLLTAEEFQRDAPDAWEYHESSLKHLEGRRADGWQVYKVLQAADNGDWAAPVYVMRRPRQQEETRATTVWVGAIVDTSDGKTGRVVAEGEESGMWLVKVDGEDEPLLYDWADIELVFPF